MAGFAVKTVAATALLVCAGAVLAQSANGAGVSNAAPQNVLQLSASGSVEVQQDVLVMHLSTTKEGSDAASVQTQLKQVLDAALTLAKRDAKPQQMEVRSGDFSLYPRSGKDGKIAGWQGRVELILEGRDFSRITTIAGAVQNMTVSSVSFSLSREAREKVEAEAQAKAIAAFKDRATSIAKNFGFSSYTLREVQVNDNGNVLMPYAASARANGGMLKSSMSDSAVPVEAGKARVEVSVSGSVQLR
ncbi:SIMPL domain-containing protein [Diaphorobacter sp. HDW4A]|uniref:SIMPL domain-containing protein n=1 Tax=Diaphorobacter sp. HDW4A TaxID=2714924 RepID=UPI00140C35C0|nr:SIMPL domain-containing protein [Diaphorobacter sp. HDW4A]QIL81018.1 SIMPL domain-containing protein [Diaphorobacter sp. HDW4A]